MYLEILVCVFSFVFYLKFSYFQGLLLTNWKCRSKADTSSRFLQSLLHFAEIQNNTECIYAKRANLWGSKDW